MDSIEIVIGYSSGVVIIAMFIWIVVMLHVAYTKMDFILDHLKNCSAITVRTPLRHGGPWGNLMLVGGISGIITFPGFYLKRGELSPEDLQAFPRVLKRKLIIMHWSALGLLATLVLLVLIGNSGLLYCSASLFCR
ncbi:hypothetical protein IB252_07255 [Pseudomonas sp. PDM10]|uniref:hypothetical protein n=1 Tax=Pseudomonas sp. PDM10 TaxID=2769269 RepID=UPI00177FEE56|nr:hypothetical protein [Pseudomonas sp. PDM10]MBD9599612.1 hypothetical protein [Pseudomonas sp. PDM10]